MNKNSYVLDEIAIRVNTDKASRWRHFEKGEIPGHFYTRFYEPFFSPLKEEAITIMELGCGPNWNVGASLRMFREYFPKARILGVDINPNAKILEKEGFEIIIGDLGDIKFLRELRSIQPQILLDDASHFWEHQVIGIVELFDSVSAGGIYIIEDINTSFGRLREQYAQRTQFSGYDFVSAVCESLHSFDDDHLKKTPYPVHIRSIANQTLYVAQATHTALFKKKVD